MNGSRNITEPKRAKANVEKCIRLCRYVYIGYMKRLDYWTIPPSLTGGKLTGFFVKTVKTRFRLIIENTEF